MLEYWSQRPSISRFLHRGPTRLTPKKGTSARHRIPQILGLRIFRLTSLHFLLRVDEQEVGVTKVSWVRASHNERLLSPTEMLRLPEKNPKESLTPKAYLSWVLPDE
jgi:hypothetical protein